jgi:hypothetical protein
MDTLTDFQIQALVFFFVPYLLVISIVAVGCVVFVIFITDKLSRLFKWIHDQFVRIRTD